MEQFFDLEEFQAFIGSEDIVVIYYSNEACNVCKTLKPGIIDLIESRFPASKLVYIDTEKSPLIAGQYRVFTIPTIDIYVLGREHARFSRNVVMHEFEDAMRKPYDIIV